MQCEQRMDKYEFVSPQSVHVTMMMYVLPKLARSIHMHWQAS